MAYDWFPIGRSVFALILVSTAGCCSTTKSNEDACTPDDAEACPVAAGAGGMRASGGTGAKASGGGTPTGEVTNAAGAEDVSAGQGGSATGGALAAGSGGSSAGAAGGSPMDGVNAGGTTGAPGAGGAGGTSEGGAGGPDAVTLGGAGGAGGSGSLLEGCVLLLHMDEPSWDGSADEVVDSSGMGNHGVSVRGISTTADGRFGRAGEFDGSGWVEVPDAPSLDPTVALTVSAWVRPTRIGTGFWPGIVTKRLGYMNQTAYSLHLGESGQVTVDVGDESDRLVGASLETTSWSHVAFVFDGALPAERRVRLYINGELDLAAGQTETTIADSTAPVIIGDLPNGGSVFEGLIDEVAVWNRALSDAEVARVAAAALR